MCGKTQQDSQSFIYLAAICLTPSRKRTAKELKLKLKSIFLEIWKSFSVSIF